MVRRLRPALRTVRNLHPQPVPTSATGRWSSQTPTGNTNTLEAGTGPMGSACLRVDVTAAGQLRLYVNSTQAANRISLEGATTVTIGCWVYASRALTDLCWEPQMLTPDGATSSYPKSSAFNLVAGWQWVSATVAVVAGRTQLGQINLLGSTNTANNVQPGDIVKATRAMIVPGTYSGVYCDGSTPGWKWDGTAGASASTGWPYTLESVAGAPRIDVSNPAAGATLAALPAGDVSIYSVFNDPTPSGTSGIHEAIGPYRLMWNAAGTRPALGRKNSSGVALETVAGIDPVAGWNAVGVAMRQSDTRQGISLRTSNVDAGASGTAATSFDGTQPLRVGTRDTGANADLLTGRMLVYPRFHDATARQAVLAWLRNRYGLAA
ncbi:hypothetical protein [Microbacterium gilvum]|uniref:Uncharacterized protein n=1 Tax=Microbacterium gilvum TaxID=1336204 RepID=A0ABP8ZRJ3_9MICO